MYCSRPSLFPAPDGAKLRSLREYFQTSAPGEWRNDPAIKAEFLSIYGEGARKWLDQGLVPENSQPEWVGGSHWSDPDRRLREIFCIEPAPAQPEPIGPTAQDSFEQTVLAKLDQILAKLA